MNNYLYILECYDRSYYIGITSSLELRLADHRKGKVKFTKSRLPVKLVYKEKHLSKSSARRREKQLKSWKKRDRIEKTIRRGSIV